MDINGAKGTIPSSFDAALRSRAMSGGWRGERSGVAVIIPTLNSEPFLDAMIAALRQQATPPSSVLVIDSGSRDGTVERFRAYGAEVVGLNGRPFNHGGTRRYATELRPGAEFYILLTQDAIPARSDAFEKILSVFSDPEIGMAYGRQLPRQGAGVIERHARLFNYPTTSELRGYPDRARLGIRTIFCSDSFAAYRANALHAVGGFPVDCYFAEDQCIAAKMLTQGYRMAYCADACVEHSHGYTLTEDFRRYFDIGVWHRRERWLLEEYGRAEGEGLRFITSELRFLLRNGPSRIPSAVLRTVAKFAGYRLGLWERHFTPTLKRKLAMQSFYWVQRAAPRKVSGSG